MKKTIRINDLYILNTTGLYFKIVEANNQHPAVPDENELREFTVNFSEVI